MLLDGWIAAPVMQKYNFDAFFRAVYEKYPVPLIVDHANTLK